MSAAVSNSDNKSVHSRESSSDDDNKITESIPFPTDEVEQMPLSTHASRLVNSEKPRSTSISIKPVKDHRRRRSSSIISHVEPESIEDENDQQLSINANVLWIDQRGAWLVHFLIIAILKVITSLLLKSNHYKHITEMFWTLTNALYCCGSYIMFHMIKGSPSDLNGAYFDNLTMWEQIDHCVQFTPA